jgi:O-antigen/teichoic acid export membrane protein
LKRPTVTRNLLGNFVGRGIGAALSLLLVPVYIRFLGIEAYGLVGFSLVLQNVIGFLDLGLSATASREIAQRLTDDERRGETRDLFRSVELIYWPLGIVLGSLIVIAAPLLAGRWLQSETLSVGVIQTAIVLMGLTFVVQWPYSLYEGALHGLQRIVEYNTVAVAIQIVRSVGAVVVVWLWPTIIAFFAWQAVVSAAGAALLATRAWKYMPAGAKPVLRPHLLKEVWRFAAGMTASMALGILLSYADRIILSRVLSLEWFGYYSVATMVSTGLMYLMSPISLTFLPRFAELLAQGRRDDLVRTYHLSAQLMASILIPVALVLSLFSREVLTIWTRNPVVADRATALVPFLVMGVLLSAIVDIPYIMQLASGHTRLAVRTNLAAVLFYLPVLAVLVHQYGAIGAAMAMLALHVTKFLIWGQAAHTELLRDEKWRWHIDDVALPALAAAAVGVLARLTLPRAAFAVPFVGVLVLGAIVAAAMVAAFAAAPLLRTRGRDLIPLLRRTLSARNEARARMDE